MPRNNFMRNGGVRAGSWSTSKYTNSRSYDPWDLEVSTVHSKINRKLHPHKGIFFYQAPTHPNFISPLKIADTKAIVEKLPAEFVQDLEAIVLLGGTNKQLKSLWLRYGVYFSNKIFIHAFPKQRLVRTYSHIPKPSILNEYRRAGAKMEERKSGFTVSFDRSALRTFFERDVLMHEIGHHVDRENYASKTEKKTEGFADWFATNYGFRNRP